ncbi:MAG TPA: MurR/RpiR family transcriptional regulator [Tissierellaceae bacterium]|jgi:DNA-binding MurR/RpiR family transcriptional regulator|nr:MurR/RpiR family transcriptional regulator [Tissierellaceae bacterium]
MVPSQNVIKNIQDNYSKLSKGQKIIAEYMINQYDKAAFMTAASLGKNLNISESTVVRFANALGYSGYKELQRELQELIRNKLTTVQRLNLSENYSKNEHTIAKVMEKDVENLRKTLSEVDFDKFYTAVEMTTKARNIYIMGLRSSSFLSGYMAFYMNFIFDNVKLVQPGANDIFEQLAKASDEDVIICLTYPRYSKRTLEALEYSKNKGCRIVSFTDSLISPAADKSDITIIARSDMLSFVDSLVAPMSLINAFIIAVGSEKKEDITPYFEELEKVWKKYSIYDENSM